METLAYIFWSKEYFEVHYELEVFARKSDMTGHFVLEYRYASTLPDVVRHLPRRGDHRFTRHIDKAEHYQQDVEGVIALANELFIKYAVPVPVRREFLAPLQELHRRGADG